MAESLKEIDFGSFARLTGFLLPATNSHPVNIREGKLAAMIKLALSLSEQEYYGLKIFIQDRVLVKKDMLELRDRPDFPK